MTPNQAKAALARMLKQHGFAATLHRGPSSAPTYSCAVTVHLMDYEAQSIVRGSGLQEGESKAIISAAELDAGGWPVDATGQRIRKGDWLTIGGRNRVVRIGWPAPPVGGVIVRYEAYVR